MNLALQALFQDEAATSKIAQKLPLAFEQVEQRVRGMAAGILREPVLVAMLMVFIGRDRVSPVRGPQYPDVDCYVAGVPLSIKTVSGSSHVKLKWTANRVKAEEFMAAYEPRADLLVARAIWSGQGGLFYFSVEAQQEVFNSLGKESYLLYSAQTNTRGVDLSPAAEVELLAHPETCSIPMSWPQREEGAFNPYQDWVDFWQAP